MDKDSEGQRKLGDSSGGLLPAVERHSLEEKRMYPSVKVQVCLGYYRNSRRHAIINICRTISNQNTKLKQNHQQYWR